MGRFEDLVAKIREGDEEAVDMLEAEFSGSGLRNQNQELASEVEALREWRTKNSDVVRERTFEGLVGSLDESLRDLVSADDFKDVDPDELTLDKVREMAVHNQSVVQSTLETAAKAAGFDTVEEYQTALDSVKQQGTERQKNLEAVGRAASGGGEGGEGGKTRFDAMKETFDQAKELGQTDADAMGEAVHTLLASQAPKAVE